MANIKLLQLYRNASLYENLSAAKTALQENAQKADGEILIARYKDSSGNPKALVGIYNGMSGQSATITYLEGVNISESGDTISASVQAAIDAAVAVETSRAETAESGLQSALTLAIEALDYTDTAVGGSFVTSVNEANGIISVTRAAIASSDKTVTVTSDESGNVDLAVNIDGSTITKSDEGKLSVASSALTQYVGANAIAISEPDTNNDKTVSLVIDESDAVLSQGESGLKTTLTITYDSGTHYISLYGNDTTTPISYFDATEFIVDGMIQKAELVTYDPSTEKSGEFLAITFNVEGGGTTTIYIDVTELVDTYTAGNGLALSDHEFSVKIADGETYLTITENSSLATIGIDSAISTAVATETTRAVAAEAALEAAIEAAVAGESTTVVEQGSSNTHVTVSSSTSGTTTTYTINESDIASATTVSNIITSAGLNSDGSLTDVTLPGGADTLVDAITALESEIKADETSLTISSSDKSITVTSSNSGTDVIVALSAVGDNSNYATNMIVKDTDGGLALNSVWDCGEY